MNRSDSFEKVTGSAIYGSDIVPENVLYAAVVRTNQPHARITSVDTTAAEKLPGVKCVLPRTEFLGLFDDRVRHYNDAIAAVAADDVQTAQRARNLIDYELEPLEQIFDPMRSVRGDGPTIHENNPDLKQDARHPFTVENDEFVANIDDYHAYSVGEVSAGFDESDIIYEQTYTTPRVNHCNLDTHCTIAEWDGDRLRLTQTLASLGRNQKMLAEFLGLDAENVEINMPSTISSSFGGRSLPKLTLEPIAASLAHHTDRPVKLWFDRVEDFTAASTRHRSYYTLKMGITADGDIRALTMDLVADTGGYPNGVGHIVLTNSGDRPPELYQLPNYEYEGVSVFTNNVPAGEYRGIGSTQAMFALESHIDEIARRADLDAFELRKQNFTQAVIDHPHTHQAVDASGILECAERGRETFERLKKGPTPDDSMLYGTGFAAGVHTTGSGAIETDASEAKLIVTSDGTIEARTASGDHGQGSDTVMAQIISEETGVPVSAMTMRRFSTTEGLVDDLGSVASRSTYIIGAAVRDAAINLADTLRKLAANELDVDEAEVTIDGEAVGPNGEVLSLTELVTIAGESIVVTGRASSDLNPPSYGVHFAEVAVDSKTGYTHINTYVAAQDVGFAINPKMVEGQIEGAICHAVEFALHSELKLDRGAPINANLADYPAISPWEMPETLVCEIIESNEESGPYGAKGIGTPAMPAIAPTIINAIRDATGIRFTQPPVDSETIIDGLSEHR